MIRIDMRRGPFRQTDIYYPTVGELRHCFENVGFTEVVNIHQAPIDWKLRSRYLKRREIFPNLHIDLTRSLDDIFGAMHARSARYLIRKAERLGDRIAIKRNDATAVSDYVEMHNRFVDIKGLARISMRRLSILAPVSDVFVAYFDGRPICGHVWVRDCQSSRVGAHLGASVRLEDRGAPVTPLNRYLYWYLIKLYKHEGFRLYDLGGAGPEAQGVADYKRYFGAQPAMEYVYVLAGPLARLAMETRAMIREAAHRRARVLGVESDDRAEGHCVNIAAEGNSKGSAFDSFNPLRRPADKQFDLRR